MNRIFKYKLEVKDYQTVVIPRNGLVLSVVNQNERMVMYALVDDAQLQTIDVKFIIYATGHPTDDLNNMRFISTVLTRNGTLVYHVFTNG